MKESAARQAEKDRQDKEARKKWLDSLSPEDRRKVKKMGLDKADTQYQVSGGDEKDYGELDSEFPYLAEIQREMAAPENTRTANSDPISHATMVKKFVAMGKQSANARFYIDCLSFASGIIDDDLTETEIAIRHNVSRSAACKYIKFLQRIFRLKPRSTQRSLETAKSDAKRARIVHARKETAFC